MNDILRMLREGDLRSDGLANEVVRMIQENPFLIDQLLEGLNVQDDIVRGHAADALEKVSRDSPELLMPKLSDLLTIARNDAVPMVRWHAAMILTNFLVLNQSVGLIESTLIALLEDPSAFVRSWSISGLCILGRIHPNKRRGILAALAKCEKDASIAVRHRAARAIKLLVDEKSKLPQGWLKTSRIDYPGFKDI